MQTRPRPKRYVRKLQARQEQVPGKPNLDLRPHQVLIRPLVTEKGTHQSSRYNSYTFQVNLHATKEQIAMAVTEMFTVRVEKVRTQIRLGKSRRYRGKLGKTPDWKKAVVTLHEDDRVDFF